MQLLLLLTPTITSSFVRGGRSLVLNVHLCANVSRRLHAARHHKSTPAKPKTILTLVVAILTAVAREASNYAPAMPTVKRLVLPQPAIGPILLVLAHTVLVVVLCFYKVRSSARWDNQNIAYRTGFLSLAQLPLIILLASKRNIIGLLTGLSYERLNWIHRWTARTLLLSSTLHMGYWFADWAPFGDYIKQKVITDATTQRGVAAWAILVWIVFSSMTPIRGWNYELFVIQHIISFIAFFAMLYLHLPSSDWTWLWVCLAIFVLDRIVRGLYIFYINCALFHLRQRREGNFSRLWASRAELTPLSGNMTRITIYDPPIGWQPGQHAFISCHSIVPLQSHPFTIASIPRDGKMEFLIKAHRGGTKELFNCAESNHVLPSIQNAMIKTVAISLDGPYGQMRPLRQFDSVVLFGGSTGATFTMPLLRDIVHGWRKDATSPEKNHRSPASCVTRRVRFVWVIKSREQLSWFSSRLFEVMDDVQALRTDGLDVMVEASVYVTCDDSFTAGWDSSMRSSASSEKPLVGQSETGIFMNDVDPRTSLGSDTLKKERQSVEIRQVDSNSSGGSVRRKSNKGCGPNGACCCQTTVDNESPDAIAMEVICHCNCSHNPDSASSAHATAESKTVATSSRPLLHPAITLLSGRPHPRNIIRKSLEGARGESAVVVCGPRGLIYDARRSVVALSDERAVHRGTGAQGIWFWSEGFGW